MVVALLRLTSQCVPCITTYILLCISLHNYSFSFNTYAHMHRIIMINAIAYTCASLMTGTPVQNEEVPTVSSHQAAPSPLPSLSSPTQRRQHNPPLSQQTRRPRHVPHGARMALRRDVNSPLVLPVEHPAAAHVAGALAPRE